MLLRPPAHTSLRFHHHGCARAVRGRTDGGASLAANCSSSRGVGRSAGRRAASRHNRRGEARAQEAEGKRARGPCPATSLRNHQRYYGYRPRVQGAEPRSGRAAALPRTRPGGTTKRPRRGCNDGTFSLEIARRFEPRMLLGVDADAGLIRAATALVARRAREVDPEALLAKTEVKGGIHQKGPLPFPHNCFFENEDVTTGGGDHSFDVISAFSVTKWIHPNHGTRGC